MKLSPVAAAVASALALAAVAAPASAAFFEPWDAAASPPSTTLRVGGSTAQDKGIILLMRRVCSLGTMTRVQNTINSAIMCEANGVDTVGGTVPLNYNFSLGTKLLVYKNSSGGSGNGVNPVALKTTLPFVNLSTLAQSQYTNTTICTISTVASTVDFADYKNYACGTNAADDTTLAPDAGLSDVEPALLSYVPLADGSNGLTSIPGPQVIFGVPVSKLFRDALQTAQSVANGGPLANACVGDASSACMPSLTKLQISSIYTGGIANANKLSNDTGVTVAGGAITICRRKAGSGTLASFSAYFMNDGCAKGVKPILGGLDGNAAIPNLTNRVMEYGATPQVMGCINAANAAGKFAIGMSGIEFAPGTAYASTGLAAPFDNDTGNWGWVKIQGYAPTLLNVVTNAKYDFLYEASYNYPTQGAGGNTHTPLLTADKIAMVGLVSDTNGTASVIKELNTQFAQIDFASGLLGKPGSPTAPSAAPAGALTEAEVIANPVNSWTRAATGAPNSCNPPFTVKETGLNMLE